MQANFPAWWRFCQLPNHDGLANDSAPGESFQTRWGFTYPTWVTARRWCGIQNVSQAVFAVQTQAAMEALAEKFFWGRQGGDLIPNGLDVVTIDWVWTSGGAAFEIQRRLGFQGFDVDGSIGPNTANRIAALGVAYIDQLTKWRKAYYDDLGFSAKTPGHAGVNPGLYSRADDCAALGKQLAHGALR